jgi:hypothetical protein
MNLRIAYKRTRRARARGGVQSFLRGEAPPHIYRTRPKVLNHHWLFSKKAITIREAARDDVSILKNRAKARIFCTRKFPPEFGLSR